MLTRRRFLRDLGTGLLVAAAAPVVLERKAWAVPRSAPVRDGSARFSEPDALLDRQAGVFAGIERTPGESDAELRARVLARLSATPKSAQYFVGEDEAFRLHHQRRLAGAFGIEQADEIDRLARERARAFVRAQALRLVADGEGLKPGELKRHLDKKMRELGLVMPSTLRWTFSV